MARVTTSTLQKMLQEHDPITMLTCTDASFAELLDGAGIDVFLIGDSLGMVVQGHDSTLPVTMDDMVYHTKCVARKTSRALVLGDLPFGSYQQSPQQAFGNAARLMSAGAHMVKLEGGEIMAQTVEFLVNRGIPVCGHIGLTPQSVHALGGFKVQGKSDDAAEALVEIGQVIAGRRCEHDGDRTRSGGRRKICFGGTGYSHHGYRGGPSLQRPRF